MINILQHLRTCLYVNPLSLISNTPSFSDRAMNRSNTQPMLMGWIEILCPPGIFPTRMGQHTGYATEKGGLT